MMVPIFLACLLCVVSRVEGSTSAQERFFNHFKGSVQGHDAMSLGGFLRMWRSWNTDSNIHELTKAEFINGWTHSGLHDSNHAGLFFLEVDMDDDLVVDDADLVKLFKIFDLNEDGYVEDVEFDKTWKALFSDLITQHQSQSHSGGDGGD